MGYPPANHYIVTKYEDGKHSIGWHFDKPKSIKKGSLITVVKTGSHGRLFQLRDRVFFTKRQDAKIKRQQERKKTLRKLVKKWKVEKRDARRLGTKFNLNDRLKLNVPLGIDAQFGINYAKIH